MEKLLREEAGFESGVDAFVSEQLDLVPEQEEASNFVCERLRWLRLQ